MIDRAYICKLCGNFRCRFRKHHCHRVQITCDGRKSQRLCCQRYASEATEWVENCRLLAKLRNLSALHTRKPRFKLIVAFRGIDQRCSQGG